MWSIAGDRRQHPRVTIQRPCKVFDPTTGKYLGGRTCDLSSGGAMIELPRLTNFKVGESLHLGIAMKRREAVLQAKEMVKVVVRRAVHTVDDHTVLGLEFQDAQAQPQPALVRQAA